MSNKILVGSLTAVLAGFLFGFDTIVISGADKKLQILWNSSDAFYESVVMPIALWATFVGLLFRSISTNRIERKIKLIINKNNVK